MFCAKQFSFQNIPERGYCWWVKLNEKMEEIVFNSLTLSFVWLKLARGTPLVQFTFETKPLKLRADYAVSLKVEPVEATYDSVSLNKFSLILAH